MVSEEDRIELVHTSDQHTKLSSGDRGQVVNIETLPTEITGQRKPVRQIWVEWDSGSRLALIEGEDEFKIISDESN